MLANKLWIVLSVFVLEWNGKANAGLAIFPSPQDSAMSHFYPYGEGAGDELLPASDDSGSVAVSIGPLKFCEDIYQRVWVNPNGILTFNYSTSIYTSEFFPWDANNSAIAPYWADVDVTNGYNPGFISYRLADNSSILQKATQDVHAAFPNYNSFVASWTLIATWHEVVFYGYIGSENETTPVVTFQVVLIGDSSGHSSFAKFSYGLDMQWTTGTVDGGNSSTGLGGNTANVGYDSTDPAKYYNHWAGKTPTIHDEVRGTFEMQALHCNDNGGGTNDPHFIISSLSSDNFFCFDYGGKEDDVLNLVSDQASEVEVEGSLFAVSKARPDVTYFKEIKIATRDATITLDRRDIYLNREVLLWNMSKSITYKGVTLRPLKQRDETIEVSLNDGSVSVVVNRHLDQIGYFLGVYISKAKGLSNNAKGILGRFVHHDFEVDEENSMVTFNLADGDIMLPVEEKLRFSPFAHGAVKCWLYAPKDEENILFKK